MLTQLSSSQVFIRIEGETDTIFEGIAYHPFPRNITTASGGTHLCDGTNDGDNPTPGPTCTTALDQVSKRPGSPFPFDGTYSDQFQDFFITSIGDSTETSTQFWGLLLDYQFTSVGGCGQEVAHDQKVLWAFDAFNKNYFLEATGPATAVVGTPFTINVIDGTSGSAISGATIDGCSGSTDTSGNISCVVNKAGKYEFKAEQPQSIRSNRVTVVASRH